MFVEVRHGRHIISIRGLINVPGGGQPSSRVVCWLLPSHTFAVAISDGDDNFSLLEIFTIAY